MWSKRPYLEIVGVWLPNKGAELMAWAVKSELGRRIPKARIVRVKQGPKLDRHRLGFIDKVAEPQTTSLKRRSKKLLESIGLRRERRVDDSKVTHYLDISGFAYGDFWGAQKAEQRAGHLTKTGKPVFLLPQAYGPFDDPSLRRVMREVCDQAKMICARDCQSFNYIKSVAPACNAHLLPDITFSLQVSDRPIVRPHSSYGCLIINSMLQRSQTTSEEKTISLYMTIGGVLRSHGIEPVIVLHEPSRDRGLSVKLAANLESDLVELEDARDLKAFIGGADIVITSRFHGLVNGLSSGVPCFSVGWSHKYRELLSDFDNEMFCYSGHDAEFIRNIDQFLRNHTAIDSTRQKISEITIAKRDALTPFWNQLAEEISNYNEDN